MPAPTEYIDTNEGLERAVAACRARDVVTVDTEFARFNTYYPIVGLVQLFDGETCYLIDPVALDSLAPLAALLEDENVTKVLHSGSEDMEVFQCAVGTVPVNLFDSQIAAAALGVGFSLSYQAMVEHYLGLTIPKDETRSDWLQRPLSESQLDYAALDVIYLLRVYEKQHAELEERGRLDWVAEESRKLSEDLPIMVEPDNLFLKARGLPGLDRRQLAVMRALYAWRERTAREENTPRNRVIDQKAILSIARSRAGHRHALHSVSELTPRQIRKYGDAMLFEIARVRQLADDDLPENVPNDRKPVDNRKLKQLKALVDERAKSLSIAPELLTRRRDLEALLRSSANGEPTLPTSLLGWRQAVVGDDLLAAVQS